MFVAPQLVLPLWPWSLTPLTCRIIGAIFCLGSAGLVVLADPRWSSVTVLLEVEMIMIPLMLIAALRALRELRPHRGTDLVTRRRLHRHLGCFGLPVGRDDRT